MPFNLSSVKKIYHSCPPFVTAPLRYVPFEVFAGPHFRNTSTLLNQFDALEIEEQTSLTDLKLVSTLNDYIKNVPFYREWSREIGIDRITNPTQLFEFPIIGKEHIANDAKAFIHDEAKCLYSVSTGGSSGAPVNFYHSPKCYGTEWAFFSNFLKSHGVSVNSRRYCLRGVDTFSADAVVATNNLYKELMISPSALSKERIGECFKQLSDFGGTWIHGYPSTVYQFCKILSELNFKLPKVKSVVLISEQVHDFQTTTIEEVLGAKVITFYGMSERVVFAPMKNDVFVPHPLYGVSEIVDGEHVATGFINDATCLVRYRTGDWLEAKTNELGLVAEFSKFQGRWKGSSLVGFGGERVNMTVLNSHSSLLKHVEKFQFRQSEMGKCELALKPSSGFIADHEQSIGDIFRNKLGSGFELTTTLVSDIETSPRGKHQYIKTDLD